ncbi:MAG: aspartate aminotransferase family protein [Ectothiorhodospiraceae bacterium AqS1]|nr:aspartate aminotransferase family protein [Ectothiorhodospiraceae bacterium AqS1]
MQWDEFEYWGQRAVRWGANYRQTLRERPVRSQITPGDVLKSLPPSPPEEPEPMEDIFSDFERLILPGMTHWQHPRFFAYFPANAAPASVLGEILADTMAAQCMLWQTSPAATELERRMIEWLRDAVGLPAKFGGVIQDTASSATLAAVLTMRERALDGKGNSRGLAGQPALRIYASNEVHSSIDRALWFSGIGADNLVRIPTAGPMRGMILERLRDAIAADRAAGFLPAGIVAAVGGTSTGACDDIAAVSQVAQEESLYLHVDAAWAGSAMICPEFRSLWHGAEHADSIVLNAHKWLGAQLECSIHLLKDENALRNTLTITREYLGTHGQQSARGELRNLSDLSLQLGRRFRALKVWFLLRAEGLARLRTMMRNHVRWAGEVAERLRDVPDIEIVTPPILSLFTFRLAPQGPPPDAIDALNLDLLARINDTGCIYLTPTRIDDRVAIRFQVGAIETAPEDIDAAIEEIRSTAAALF